MILFDQLCGVKDVRQLVKSKVIEYTKGVLLKSLLKGSKCDGITLNFPYNGSMLPYLSELEYEKSRIIFMFRSRMFPTRVMSRYSHPVRRGECGMLRWRISSTEESGLVIVSMIRAI